MKATYCVIGIETSECAVQASCDVDNATGVGIALAKALLMRGPVVNESGYLVLASAIRWYGEHVMTEAPCMSSEDSAVAQAARRMMTAARDFLRDHEATYQGASDERSSLG